MSSKLTTIIGCKLPFQPLNLMSVFVTKNRSINLATRSFSFAHKMIDNNFKWLAAMVNLFSFILDCILAKNHPEYRSVLIYGGTSAVNFDSQKKFNESFVLMPICFF